MCLSIHLSICLSIYSFIHLSIYVSIYPSFYPCFHLAIYLCTYLCIYLSIYPSIYLSIYLLIYVSVCPSIYQPIFVSLHFSIYILIYPSIDLCIYPGKFSALCFSHIYLKHQNPTQFFNQVPCETPKYQIVKILAWRWIPQGTTLLSLLFTSRSALCCPKLTKNARKQQKILHSKHATTYFPATRQHSNHHFIFEEWTTYGLATR